MNTTETDQLRFRLNDAELPNNLLRKINQMYRMQAPRYRTRSGYWWIYRLDPDHWPWQGENTLEITLLARNSDVTPPIYIRDVELEVKYLMGKHFHRGQDLDLGAYESSGI